MITVGDYEELLGYMNVLSKWKNIDQLGKKLLAVGAGHLKFLKYALKDMNRLSIGEQFELEDLIVGFKEIVVEYMQEMNISN